MRKYTKSLLCLVLAALLTLGGVPLWVPVADASTKVNLSLQKLKYTTKRAEVSAGSDYTTVIKSDGSLWVWGHNHAAQLGDGTTTNRLTPIQTIENVTKVAAGYQHTAAIQSDKSLWTWGRNEAGQLGDGTKEDRHSPVKVMDNVTAVSAGYTHTAAIQSDGSLWTWGNNISGQLGNGGEALGQYLTPSKIMDDVTAVATGQDHTVAIKTDGSLWGWGSNLAGQLGTGTQGSEKPPAKIMDDVVAVSTKNKHTVAIKTDGSLWAWGDNSAGQLGDGTKEHRMNPVKVMDNVMAVSTGTFCTAAIQSDGSLWTWGSNSLGQLGDGTKENRINPVKVMDNVAAVSVGDIHTVAVKTDGSLWAWGYNKYGGIGDGTEGETYRLTPVKIMDGVGVNQVHTVAGEFRTSETEYIYEETPEPDIAFPPLAAIDTPEKAVQAVKQVSDTLTPEQKKLPGVTDKLILFAEEAAAMANAQTVTGDKLTVKAADVPDPASTLQAVEQTLTSSGVPMVREMRSFLTYKMGSKAASVQTEALPDNIDGVRVVTPDGSSATVSAQTPSDFTLTQKEGQTVEVKFNTPPTASVTVAFPGMSEDHAYKAVLDEKGNPVGGKYNPSSEMMEAKIKDSGVYTIKDNPKDFTDIKGKSQMMQDAIKQLASKGIINGTSATAFSPDKTISRAEVTALLMRTLSLLDPNEDGKFKDVTSANWFFGAAGSAKKYNIINGYEDNTFRGNNVIAKDQIIAVSARTLREQMKYKTPADIAGTLAVYGDSNDIRDWAKEDVALATMANLVLYRKDGKFAGSAGMKRGDAAIIIKRLFDKLW